LATRTTPSAYWAHDSTAASTGVGNTGTQTQRPDEQRAFADAERLRFPLLSDAGLALAAALRLPTFRAGGVSRLKRLTLVVDRDRTVRHVLYPVTDVAASVSEALRAVRRSG
jgi:peroxiredoxin